MNSCQYNPRKLDHPVVSIISGKHSFTDWCATAKLDQQDIPQNLGAVNFLGILFPNSLGRKRNSYKGFIQMFHDVSYLMCSKYLSLQFINKKPSLCPPISCVETKLLTPMLVLHMGSSNDEELPKMPAFTWSWDPGGWTAWLMYTGRGPPGHLFLFWFITPCRKQGHTVTPWVAVLVFFSFARQLFSFCETALKCETTCLPDGSYAIAS